MISTNRTNSIHASSASYRRRRCLCIWMVSVGLLSPPNLAIAADDTSPTVLIIPHTHWEGAFAKTREEYLEIGLPYILKVLYLLKKYPNYHFVLDQMCYVRPFLERYPSEVSTFRKFLAEGRLQIVGGTDTMHDNNMPSGESISRQFLFAKSYFREKLSYDVTTGWALDTFGHSGQMPQILKLAGMKSYWFMRGAPTTEMPSELLWQGIDGSRIPAFWLPLSYDAIGVPGTSAAFDQILRSLFNELTQFGNHPVRVLLAGTDVGEPWEALPGWVDNFNKSSSYLTARIATAADFETIVAKRGSQPTFSGELNPVGQGIYSNRIELKQTMRELESLLTTAEKVNVVASLLGSGSDPERIERAWEPVLFNAEHDPAAGSIADKVYANEVEDYSRARHMGQESVDRDLESVMTLVDTTGAGVPLVAFNTLGWRRTDLAEVNVPFSDPGVYDFSVVDPGGNSVPFQILNLERYGDGGISEARIAFIASDIPSLGYAVYHAVPITTTTRASLPSVDKLESDTLSKLSDSSYRDSGIIENDLYRISFDLRTGAMTSLVFKEGNWQVLRSPANVVSREDDYGDPWELYGAFSGGIVSTKKPGLAPRPRYTQWSNDFVSYGAVTSGPVFSEYRLNLRPFAQNQFATRVRIYNGLRRIDIKTELVNQEKFVRYRVLFPTTLASGMLTEEIPFGAIERRQQQEFPAENWIDFSDGRRGLTLLNRGIPGNNVADGSLMLSLMRSSNLDPFFGQAEGSDMPRIESDTGLGVGRKYTLEYALIPHAGSWRSTSPWRDGMEFNNPLIVRAVAAHPGDLGKFQSFLDISQDNVVLSALKSAKNRSSVVLRVYEAAGKATHDVRAKLSFSGRKIGTVHEANLLEDPGEQVATDGSVFSFDLRPFEIKTFMIATKLITAPDQH